MAACVVLGERQMHPYRKSCSPISALWEPPAESSPCQAEAGWLLEAMVILPVGPKE